MKGLYQFADPETVLRDLAIATTGKTEDLEADLVTEDIRLRYFRGLALVILLCGSDMKAVEYSRKAMMDAAEMDRDQLLAKCAKALPVLTVMLIKK